MVETKARVSRLDGAETKADSRQRAKESQEQKEHPVSKDAGLEMQERGPSTAFISSLLPKPCSQGTLPHRKTGHTPLGHLRWDPMLTSHQDCQDVWGLPVIKKGSFSDCPSFSSCPGTFPQPPCALHTRLSCPGWDLAIQGSASRLYDPLPYGWGNPWENGAGFD